MNLKKKIEVVMLPANRQDLSYIGMYIDTINLVYNDHKTDIDRGVPQHLYFLSDEKIEDDDWCLVKNKIISLFKYKKNTCEEVFCKKIIATTDKTLTYFVAHTDCNGLGCDKCLEHALPQPSPQFIQKFIEEWNKGNKIEWINVEYEDELWEAKAFDNKYVQGTKERCLNFIEFQVYGMEESLKQINEYKLKVDKNNYITITKIKDSWSREEVKNILDNFVTNVASNQATLQFLFEVKNKWIEDNL